MWARTAGRSAALLSRRGSLAQRRLASAAAQNPKKTGGGAGSRGGSQQQSAEVLDPMDRVFGTEDFAAKNLRQAAPELLDPRTFDELRQAQPHLLSLSEAKYQSLDPHDYLLPEDQAFHPVQRGQFVIGDVASAAHAHADPASVGKFFPLRNIPEGVSKQLESELDATEDRLLMVRKPAVRVIAAMQAFAAGDHRNGPDAAVLLGGERGTGKSATLAHVVDFARGNGWLTLFVPRMHSILHDSPFMEPSRRRKGFFDQPVFAKQLLANFERGNAAGGLLADVALKTAGAPEAEGRLDEFSTLAELVAQHSNDDPQVDHVGLVLDLLRELAVATEHPVLLALDDYNQCYQPTGYFYDSLPVQAEQLTLVNALRFFKPTAAAHDGGAAQYAFAPEHPLRNGIVVAAESHHRPLSREAQGVHRPVWKAIARAAPGGRMAHQRYSLAEVESCMRHYFHHDLCFQEPTATAVRTLHLLTDGKPGEVMLRAANPATFHVQVHLPGGQPGGRHNQWKNPR